VRCALPSPIACIHISCLYRALSPASGLSIVVVIYKVAFPRISQLGRLPNSQIYRSLRLYPEAEETPGVLLLRVDAPLLFFNIEVGSQLLLVLRQPFCYSHCCDTQHPACSERLSCASLPISFGPFVVSHPLLHLQPFTLQGVKEYVRKEITKSRADGKKSGIPVRVVVLDLAPVTGGGNSCCSGPVLQLCSCLWLLFCGR
jgi:hypothetical protein